MADLAVTYRPVHRHAITVLKRPPHPVGSPDLLILSAWIDAVEDGRDPIAAVESAVLRAKEGRSRRILGDAYYRVPEWLRPALGRPDGLYLLLGRWDGAGAFVPGLIELEEHEARAYWLRIRGWSALAIARELTPINRQFDRRLWLPVERVYEYCSRAKACVRRCFGV